MVPSKFFAVVAYDHSEYVVLGDGDLQSALEIFYGSRYDRHFCFAQG